MEILEYGLVKRAWGLGPIQCKLEKEVCGHCMKKHGFIFGYYRDYYDQSKKSVILGSSYENAHERMNEVKAFLWKKKFFRFFVELLGLVTPRNSWAHHVVRGGSKLHWYKKQGRKGTANPIKPTEVESGNKGLWHSEGCVGPGSHRMQVCAVWQILSEGSTNMAWQKLSEQVCHNRTLSGSLRTNTTKCVSRCQL